MPAAITQSQASDLEHRISALERRVGVDRQRRANLHGNRNINFESIDDRLSGLKSNLTRSIANAAAATNASSGNNNNNNAVSSTTLRSNETTWKEIQKLLKELDPGIALTHQQQPLLYKRQQVLACSDELRNDFGELSAILKLLLSGTKVDGASFHGGAAPPQPTTKKGSSGSGGGNNSNGGYNTPLSSSTPMMMKQQKLASASNNNNNNKQQQQQLDTKKQPPEKKPKDPKINDSSLLSSSASNPDSSLRLDQVTQAPILTQHAAAIVAGRQSAVDDLRHTLLDLNARTQALQTTLKRYLECYHVATMAVSEKIILADERINAAAAAAKAATQSS